MTEIYVLVNQFIFPMWHRQCYDWLLILTVWAWRRHKAAKKRCYFVSKLMTTVFIALPLALLGSAQHNSQIQVQLQNPIFLTDPV